MSPGLAAEPWKPMLVAMIVGCAAVKVSLLAAAGNGLA
jgi:hypothetical protein